MMRRRAGLGPSGLGPIAKTDPSIGKTALVQEIQLCMAFARQDPPAAAKQSRHDEQMKLVARRHNPDVAVEALRCTPATRWGPTGPLAAAVKAAVRFAFDSRCSGATARGRAKRTSPSTWWEASRATAMSASYSVPPSAGQLAQ